MATAAQVIKAAFQKIIAQASEADLEEDEYSDAMFSLNNFMLALDAQGVTLGFTEVTSLGDDVTVPVGALRGVIYNLALELAPEYEAQLSPVAAAIAADGMKAMRDLGVSTPTSSMPCTLPRGSGNEGSFGSDWGSPFYPEGEEQILRETTGAIAVETGTGDAV